MIGTLKYRLLNWILGSCSCCLLYGYVINNIPYQLCELEHENLFVADADMWMPWWSTPGGMAEVACRWLLQFLALPYVGGALFLLPVILLWPVSLLLLRKRGITSGFCYAGAFGIVVIQFFAQYDFNFYLSGSIAMLGAWLGLYAVSWIKSAKWQAMVFVLGIPCVAWLFGAVVTVYVACGVVLFFSVRRWLCTLVLPLVAFTLVLGIGYWGGYIERLALFTSPAFYYRPQIEMPVILWLPWIFPVVFFGMGRLFPVWGTCWKSMVRGVADLCMWGVVIAGFIRYEGSFRNTSNQILWQLNHYSFMEDWQGMLDFLSAKSPLTNSLYMNYANMALAQTGHLGDYAFHFSPRGVKSLLVEPNGTASVHMLMSDVQYNIGWIAGAQRHAFEAQVALPRMCGIQTLMRLVKTNLILGHDAVAEKYLNLIGKTFFYKEWAEHYRHFLYNEKALEADAELGGKRRRLNSRNHFFMSDGWNEALKEILQVEPADKKAVDYLGVSYLLAKDLNGFCGFLETYYGTEGLRKLPFAFQQGVIALFPDETEKWDYYHLDPQVKELYSRYLEAFRNARRLPGKKQRMKKDFGYTFWYYLMFTKI